MMLYRFDYRLSSCVVSVRKAGLVVRSERGIPQELLWFERVVITELFKVSSALLLVSPRLVLGCHETDDVALLFQKCQTDAQYVENSSGSPQ